MDLIGKREKTPIYSLIILMTELKCDRPEGFKFSVFDMIYVILGSPVYLTLFTLGSTIGIVVLSIIAMYEYFTKDSI